MMKLNKTEQYLNFCCEIGRELIQNGAEIYRVEEAAYRILAAYGYTDVEVFAIPSCIILNIQDEERNYTKSVRTRTISNNMDKLEKLNDLCRSVCANTPDIREAGQRLCAIVSAPAYPLWSGYLVFGLVATFFTLFWGGTLLDAAVAFFCGLVTKATCYYFGRLNANIFFTNIAASTFLSVIPTVLSYLGTGINPPQIIIGTIMLLVPGIAITNVMRDVIAGDFLTALTKFAEVTIISVAIAIGIALPITIFRFFTGVF